MNILKSPILKTTSLAFVIFLTGCGEKQTAEENDNAVEEQKPAGQVVARVNGEEITIYELNNELARVKISDANRETVTKNILKSLVVRTIFEQNAKKNKLDRTPRTMMDMERSKSTILAKAYLQSQMVKKDTVSRNEVEDFIFANPHRFSNRAYYTFNTIVVPNSFLTKERREAWELVKNLDEIESVLLQESIEYKRMPYTAYSESLPRGIIDDMPKLKLNGDVFFIVMKDVSYLNIYSSSRPAVLTGDKAFMVAEKHLANQKTKDYLVKLEAESLAGAEVEYLGDYKDITPVKNPETVKEAEVEKQVETDNAEPASTEDK